MADIRIKDITTTASASLTGDFLPIDGSTGTRKLSAFSPTFGGNATVTGTLTANSAITGPTLAPGVNTAAHYFTAYGATTSWPLRLSTIYDSNYVDQYLTLNGTLTGSRATPTFTGAAVGGSFIRSNGENSVLSVGTFVSGAGAAINTVAVFNPTNVTIPQTTASTTTSTGALVVGNGTSGGLGVGGSAFIGGALNMYGEDFNIHNVGYGSWTLRNTAGSAVFDIRNGAGSWLTFPGAATGTVEFKTLATTVKVSATTASTSTSSGALVVSGGVGVAGAVNAGGTITSTNGSGSGLLGMRSSSGNASYVFWSETGVADRGILGFNNGSSTLSYRSFSSSFSTGTEVFSVTSAGNITTGGNITTAAPAGGTAAAWKLGTVATVSPTSPNRTIEVDIGGTIYYLAAKTTNN